MDTLNKEGKPLQLTSVNFERGTTPRGQNMGTCGPTPLV